MIVLVPTRGRPANIAALRQAIDATARGNVQLVLAVDDDDPELAAYLALGEEMVVGKPKRLGPWLNLLAVDLAGDDPIISFMGDDHKPRTPGWDLAIEAALELPGIVYGDDLIQGALLPTAVFMSSSIVTTLGWFAPPGLIHLFLDDSWKQLGEAASCLRYLPEVVIEHCHPIANKGVMEDDGYRRANAPEVWAADRATFDAWVLNDLAADAAKIKAL